MAERRKGQGQNPLRDLGQGGQRTDDARASHAATRRDEESQDERSREELRMTDLNEPRSPGAPRR